MMYPPLSTDFRFPVLHLETDDGRSVELGQLLQNSNPDHVTLLMPGFSMCHGTCPLLIQSYKKLLAQMPKKSFSVFSCLKRGGVLEPPLTFRRV